MKLLSLRIKSLRDNKMSYNGPNDEWKYPAIAWRDTVISEGERICQFRVQLSQKASLLHKLKWFLSNGIEIVEIDELKNKDRNGIGSTGNK